MLGAKALVVTALLVSPEATVIAFTVRLDATRNGAVYGCEEVVGVEPSSVK
jgi:hypothetical protein